MFSNIIIKFLRNKKKVDVFDLILKIKRFKSKSNAIFLLKIKKNNEENDSFKKKKSGFVEFENEL